MQVRVNTSFALCRKLVETAVETFGRLDLLILNAGVSAHFLFEDTKDMSIFRKMMDVNFFGYLYPTRLAFTLLYHYRYALPYLKKSHGQILVMNSYSGEIGLMFRSAYCSTKFAVSGLFESLRMEVGDQIDITIVCPITIETDFRHH